jgi:DNA adenine methylase
MGQQQELGQVVPPVNGPLKWHGGKSYLAAAIVARMPRHLHYVEPYAGGLAVLFRHDPADRRLWLPPDAQTGKRTAALSGVSEVVNDLHRDLTTFWRVLQGEDTFARFRRAALALPFSQVEWQDARAGLANRQDADPVQRAVWLFVACRQSLAGRMDSFAPLSRSRTRQSMNEQAAAWLSAVAGLPAVHARLCRVAILDRPALDVIRAQDGPTTLFYCDPPYLASTRASPNVYAVEMTEADHQELLEALLQVQGKVILSGYPSNLYDDALKGWTRHVLEKPNQAAGGKTKRRMQEVLWMNYDPAEEAPIYQELQGDVDERATTP